MKRNDKLMTELEAYPSFNALKKVITHELLEDDGTTLFSKYIDEIEDDNTYSRRVDLALETIFDERVAKEDQYDLVHEKLYDEVVAFVMDLAKEIIR